MANARLTELQRLKKEEEERRKKQEQLDLETKQREAQERQRRLQTSKAIIASASARPPPPPTPIAVTAVSAIATVGNHRRSKSAHWQPEKKHKETSRQKQLTDDELRKLAQDNLRAKQEAMKMWTSPLTIQPTRQSTRDHVVVNTLSNTAKRKTPVTLSLPPMSAIGQKNSLSTMSSSPKNPLLSSSSTLSSSTLSSAFGDAQTKRVYSRPKAKTKPVNSNNNKRRRGHDGGDDDDDDDLEGFVEKDEDEPAPSQVSRMIQQMYGYNRSRYNDDGDDSTMEASLDQIEREDARSRRIARAEDEREERLEQLRQERKRHKTVP